MDIDSNPLFQLAPIAYSIIDLDLQQIAANQKFAELFGYGEGERPSAVALTHPDDLKASIDYLNGVVDGTIEDSIEKRYLRADGSVFWGRLTARKITIDGTAVLLGVIEDVQQTHDLLEHLAESTIEAREQADLRSRFISQVSHELRNPLHLIAGTSELINNHASLPMKQRQQAAAIHREALSLAGLVDDLLDIGRVDAGQLTLDRSPFSTRSLVHRVHQTMLPHAQAKGLQFDVAVDDAVPVHVIGDEGRLRQILVNLTSNAVKFTPRGSVTLDVDVDLDMVRCRVIDSGPGIPEGGMDTIFEPFVRLSRVESGNGLGLAISSRLASLLDGTLTVENIQPSGAAFELRVPLEETSERAEIPADPTSADDGPPMHVLIVEDNIENQLLASAQLDALGFTCEIANDGYEALDRIGASTFDAILMDWHLPGIDGLETTRRIRAREVDRGERRRPIIALTARAMAADVKACFEAGADDHISKPAGLAALRQALVRWTSDLPDAQGSGNVASSMVNRSALMDLFDNLGDVDLVASIVATYLEELDGRVERILTGEDAPAVESAAHVLASTSSIVGANGLHDVAREIEDSVRAGAEPGEDVLRRLIADAEQTAATLADEFDLLKAGT